MINMTKEIYILLGPQGSGKSTQADLIAKKLKFSKIVESNLLKKEANKKTQNGKKIKRIMEKGDLVPFEISCDLLFKKIKSTKKNKILIDGFPREPEQAHVLDYFIYANKYNLKEVIYIDTSINECIKRMKLRKRADDKPNIIKERLKLYFKDTKPLIKYYKKQNKLIKVNGNGSIESIFNNILKKI